MSRFDYGVSRLADARAGGVTLSYNPFGKARPSFSGVDPGQATVKSRVFGDGERMYSESKGWMPRVLFCGGLGAKETS